MTNHSTKSATPSSTLAALRARLREQANEEKAVVLRSFFKTGPGEYGEGDVFIGVQVPALRALAKSAGDLPEANVQALLRSPVHEERLLALLLMVMAFPKAGPTEQRRLYGFYLAHTAWINNWDLVDLSAPQIVGGYLLERSRAPLRRLARSRSLWERRIAIVATIAFIRKNEYKDTLAVAAMLLGDKEDLIHKATGWMLREVGKRSLSAEEGFLRPHVNDMPRTMLRYAIERFPEEKRKAYLHGTIGA